MSDESDSQKRKKYIPASEWPKHHDWPPMGGLRYYIFNENQNGFHKCVKRVGRRVLIDEDAFFEWVDEQGGAA